MNFLFFVLQICYGSGLGGSLRGKVAVKKGSTECRSMKLNVNYGNGKMPVTHGICLEYDLGTMELIDAAEKNLEKITVECSKIKIGLQ